MPVEFPTHEQAEAHGRFTEEPTRPKGLDNVKAVFITHHHSDHMVDYPNLLLLAWHNGSNGLKKPIKVLGPGDRGTLPPIFAEEKREHLPEVFHP